ncbi:hypothetical protein VCRA2110O2_30311 [Vibrio crassostreae]|nr:hypothetical protein VCRA2110O2_30311 [Vibrio crassostreae]
MHPLFNAEFSTSFLMSLKGNMKYFSYNSFHASSSGNTLFEGGILGMINTNPSKPPTSL